MVYTSSQLQEPIDSIYMLLTVINNILVKVLIPITSLYNHVRKRQFRHGGPEGFNCLSLAGTLPGMAFHVGFRRL